MKSWLTTTDHKRIGLLYFWTAFSFFLVGGLEALIIRAQLIKPDGGLGVSAETFNQLFTMHGTTMVFLALMPLSAAFFNFIIPLQIGARDVAFPRLNAFSYWVFLLGGLFLNASWFVGPLFHQPHLNVAPDAGWFGYATLTEKPFSVGPHTDFWLVGLLFLGVSSIISALNFLITILNLRAPGMTFWRLPMLVWMQITAAALFLVSVGPLVAGAVMLFLDRTAGTGFFLPDRGGDPLLWQHLFWFFGHPEVYVVLLPAMGIVAEVITTFARKKLFAYKIILYTTFATGVLSFVV